MNQLFTLIAMQMRDKIDLGWLKDSKLRLRTILLFILKFIVITGLAFGLLYICFLLGIFYSSESYNVMIIVLTLSLLLSLISCTVSLMKNLYFSEDNRVLITLPVKANKIFISKLLVFYIYELKRSFSFLIPIIIACLLQLILRQLCPWGILLWMWIPTIFIVALPVLFGAILSIPAMYIYRFLKKYSILEVIIFILILSGLIFGAVYLIGLFPKNVDLIQQWPSIKIAMNRFILMLESRLMIMSHLIRIIIGEQQTNLKFSLEWITLLKFAILLAVLALSFIIVYFASRPLFFKMMAKNFEVNKNVDVKGTNKKHGKYQTFINKEFKINLRTIDISINYLMVYIIVPLLILLLNALYKAMDTKELGNMLIYAFNALLICLPLLASNAMVATYYSREGRAGYMKKSKPIFAAYPLFAKLFFNMVFSIPSVFITTYIFGHSAGFNFIQILLFGLAILFIHYGHMIWSAMLDIMNPQNEQYATTGVTVDNPNENKSTGLAFVISFIFALVTYKLLSESSLYEGNINLGCFKLMLVGLLFLGSIVLLFFKRIKAYYYEIQGDHQ